MKKYTFISILISLLFLQNRDVPQFNVITNNNPYPTKLFIHSMSNYMSIIDTSLNYYWIINNNNKGMDFKASNSKLSYFSKPSVGDDVPYWIIADQSMTEIDSIQCTLGNTDYHDIIITDYNTYILFSYNSEVYDLTSIGGNEFQVISGILRMQEFDYNHNLIFDWYAPNYLDILDYQNILSPGFGPGQTEWMHTNSIELDLDNNLIVSNRKSSEIIKINKETGDIIWILGGPLNEFEIINDPFNGVSSQHDASILPNGNLLIFDNGVYHNPPTTRIVEYEIDEINKTATLVWEFQQPNMYVGIAMGSAQRLPNQNTLINWGSIIEDGESLGANIMEVDYEKNIVLEIQFESHQTYKATKSEFEFSIPMMIGDPNLDNTINVTDVIYMVNYVLSDIENNSIFYLYKIDLNLDHNINIVDIIELVSRILD